MGIIRKLIKYLLTLIVILVLASPLWIKIIPTKYFSTLGDKSPIVDKYLCSYSTKISGESMNPIVTPGTSINLMRCFNEDDLNEGTIVLFHDGPNLRFGIIRHVLPLTPIVYKISDEKAPELFHDIIKSEIIGITHDIDVSGSKYKIKQGTESFILNADDYLTDLYLAKIPKGAGIETSTLEKTTSFSFERDKFCFVIVPKKNLNTVEIGIVDTKNQSIISLGENIVFNISSKPNINCMDFGSAIGMLNLKQGDYDYKFFLNHQPLKSIRFEVE